MAAPGFTVFNSDPKNNAAVVFVHGFTGDMRKTWRNIPDLLKQDGRLKDWDMVGFGYSSTRWFDLPGLWSADAALPEIATMLYSRPEIAPNKYKQLAFVAHSMGGLVVQKAIASHADLCNRVSYVVLFGTPSNGLEKAGAADFFKRQIDNMVAGGEFIKTMRAAWDGQNLSTSGRFSFTAVAGEKDQFVPPESSLRCFPDDVCRVIPGNHLTMLDGDTVDAPAVQMILQAMTGATVPHGTKSTAHAAIEKSGFHDIVARLWPEYLQNPKSPGPFPALDDFGAGQLGMALEKLGDSATAVKFLSAHKADGTDVLGILAGRLKRRWWLQSRKDDLDQALAFYIQGYDKATAKTPVDHDQAYYHGINVAYLTLATKDIPKAREWAGKVLTHTPNFLDPKMKKWILATEADALMIRGDIDAGLAKHKASAAQQGLDPWEALSMEEQAMRVADLCGVPDANIKDLGGWYEDRP